MACWANTFTRLPSVSTAVTVIDASTNECALANEEHPA
jgi:hypothetical protein